jgi:hypothetical protein
MTENTETAPEFDVGPPGPVLDSRDQPVVTPKVEAALVTDVTAHPDSDPEPEEEVVPQDDGNDDAPVPEDDDPDLLSLIADVDTDAVDEPFDAEDEAAVDSGALSVEEETP